MKEYAAKIIISTVCIFMAIFSQFQPTASAMEPFQAQFIAENASHITVHPGETKSFWVDLKNTGSEPWLFGWPSHEVVLAHTDNTYSYEIGSMYGDYNNWLTFSRPAAPNYAGIYSGGVGRFEFKITGQEEIGTTRMYLRPVKADGTFLNNEGIWFDIEVVPYPAFEAQTGVATNDQALISWEMYTGSDFGAYNIYKFPKTYPDLRYYTGGDWNKNFQYIPQLHPYYLETTITDINQISYTSSLEQEKTYVYIVDAVDVSGNTIARSNQSEVRNVSSYLVKPQERGQRIYYDPKLGDYRNTETRGYIESSMRWSTDSSEILHSLSVLPQTYAHSSTQGLVDFVMESMPRGAAVHRWADFKYGQGTSVFVDPQLRFDNGLYLVTGDLSVPRLTFQESTYGSGILGGMRFAYGYDGLEPIELTNPDMRQVTFNEKDNAMTIELMKEENRVQVYFKIVIHGGVIEAEGSIKAVQGSIANPRLIIKTTSNDAIGSTAFFDSVKQWDSNAWLLYNDGQGFVRGEDLAKNHPERFEGILQSNGSSYFKYNGVLHEGEQWSEYLEKLRYGSHMLGGTADAYEPVVYQSEQYDNYLFGRLMNYGYPLMGLASWSSNHLQDAAARATVNDAIKLIYNNLQNYTNHNWNSYEDIDNGSLYYGEMGPILYALSMLADTDNTTQIEGKSYAELAQYVYDKLPAAASHLFAVDNDALGNVILGIRHFKGQSDAKAAQYESCLLDITEQNNKGYYTPKTYLSYTDKNSAKALTALSLFLQLPQWNTEDALVIRNEMGYAGMGEAQAWGQLLFDDLEKNLGGVYPIVIGTDSRHEYQNIRITNMNWQPSTKTLSINFNRSFEELDVYTGEHSLEAVKLNGAVLNNGTDYTFDPVTHILRVYKADQAAGAFTIEVIVQ